MAVVSDFTLYGVEEHQIDSSDNLTFLDSGTGNQLKLQLYAPVITFGGLTVPGTIFATGETDPTTGDGVAIYHNGTQGYIRGYNYGTAAFEQLVIDGNPLGLNTSSNNPIITGASYINTGGGIQVGGSALNTVGSNVEVFFTGVSGPGNVRAYNENGAVYLVLDLDGSTLNLNSVSNGAINTGTGVFTIGGPLANIGINLAPQTYAGVYLSGTMTGSASQYGAVIAPTFNSSAVTSTNGLLVQPSTQAASFTDGQHIGIQIVDVSKGAGSSVTSSYGLYIAAVSAGASANYAIYTNAGTVRLGGDLAHAGSNVGFFNHAVSAQQSAVGAAAGYTAGTTAATFHSDDKYSGNTGATSYTINGIVAALKAYGLLAA